MDVSPVVYGGDHDLVYRLTRDKLAQLPELTGIFVSGAGLARALPPATPLSPSSRSPAIS